MSNAEIINFLSKNKIIFFKNYDLKYRTYAKTGHKTNIYICIDDKQKFIDLLEYLVRNKISYKVVGETSNILFLDDVVYNIVISTGLLDSLSFSEGELTVGAGKSLIDLVKILHSKNIKGFEGLEGIPGSVGGALFMNAGAYGYSISDCLKCVSVVNIETGLVSEIPKNDLSFSMRDSTFRKSDKFIILEATFFMKVGRADNIYKNAEKYHIARHLYQEFVYPNLGSTFTSKLSTYDELSKIDRTFGFLYYFVKKIFFNKIMRFINRKSPNRKILNLLVERWFKLGLYSSYSIKNINTFVNRNSNSSEIIEYMYKLKKILRGRIVIENEIVLDSIYDDNNLEKSIYDKIDFIKK